MKFLRTKLVYFIIPALIFIGGMFLAGSKTEDGEKYKHLSEHLTRVSLNPPDDLNFSGELVPLRDFDVQERFDQELIRNVFYHSSTIMTLKRASRWKKEIVSILKKNGIPEDFFYLCVAESHLTNATSPAGAKGFWQFMKGTALMYGLEVNGEVDERYDPIKSTYAACKYLKDGYRKFGNWTLVAASYNMGMAGLMNQIEKQQVDNYYDLYLNAETAAYVYRIVALKTIFENPVQYGFNPEDFGTYSPLRYQTIVVTETIDDLVSFAIKNGTTYKNLKILNPWIKGDKLLVVEGSTYTIKLPTDAVIMADELKTDSVAVDSVKVQSIDTLVPDTMKKMPVKQDSAPKKGTVKE